MRTLTKLIRNFATNVSSSSKTTTSTSINVDPLKNVIGLSSKIVQNNDQKAVPGTGKDYKVAEYFGYNRMSYHEAEVEMEKFRIPQPVAPRK